MEKSNDSEPDRDEKSFHEEEITNIEKSSLEHELKSCSTDKEQVDDHDQLELAKAEMDQLMEENQKLKMRLNALLKDYRSLQDKITDDNNPSKAPDNDHNNEESELIALSLGRTSSGLMIKHEHDHKIISSSSRTTDQKSDEIEEKLTLGLNCKFDEHLVRVDRNSPDDPNPNNQNSSSEETKKLDAQVHDPTTFISDNSTMKNNIHARDGHEDDEISQENPVKRARVSVRVRCETPTMNDGCQWRKYGQKISKGNPCPRAYYRCTVAPSCPVRKQVQRCVDDLSILTTTYEGTHNHPLPVSATSMASTTSAAASMLMSGSSSSSIITTALNGLNVYLPEYSRTSSTKPFNYLLNSSSISTSTPYPTITLDLTSSPYSSFPSTTHPRNFPMRFSSSATNLNFNTLQSSPIPWSNGSSTYSYGSSTTITTHQPIVFNNNNQTPSSLSFGPNPSEISSYQSFLQKNPNPNHQQSSLASPDTIAAATKAITSDPNFQSALAAALSSIIGSSSSASGASCNDDHHQPNKFPVLSSSPPLINSSKDSALNKSSSSRSAGSQPAGVMFLSPNFQTSNSKSKGDDRDRNV